MRSVNQPERPSRPDRRGLSEAFSRWHTDRVRSSKVAAVAVTALAAFGLTACSQPTPSTPVSSSGTAVTEPVVMNVDALQGTTVDISVGQALDIDTGDLAVDSYTAKMGDTSVAEFVEGKDSGGATFNPGVRALAVGTTKVTLANDDGAIEDVVFTVDVTEAGSR